MTHLTVSVVSGCAVGDGETNAEQRFRYCWWPEMRGVAVLPVGNGSQNPHLENNPFLLSRFFSLEAPLCIALRVWGFCFIAVPSPALPMLETKYK